MSQPERQLDAPTGSDEPPSPAKLALIRRYLQLNGTQRQIDTGSFLERHAMPGGALSAAMAERGGQATLMDLFRIPLAPFAAPTRRTATCGRGSMSGTSTGNIARKSSGRSSPSWKAMRAATS